MIFKYTKGSKSFNFYDSKIDNNHNIFTVIVGKNGTGKSRLLNDIISKFVPISQVNTTTFISQNYRKINTDIDLEISENPNKVIAVSTSPYDKFPLPRFHLSKYNIDKFYSYVGIRDLRTTNFSLGFMSKIIGQLLMIRSQNKDQFAKIINVLNYLGYSDEFHIAFEYRILSSELEALLKSKQAEETFFEIFSQRNINRPHLHFFRTEDDKLDIDKFNKLKNILEQIKNRRRIIYNLVLDSNTIDSEIDIENISFLIEAGVARLRDVGLRKLANNKIFKISDASSGEQCIFTTLVGISCNITDNALILIDEPEISLHPEWQEKYIQLLIETFKKFKNCHFIIATHSPQLISKLSTENCYILQMDNKELMNAKYYANNSIDFQLANVFNHPGFKNEYLLRIAMNIFSNISKNKKFKKNDLENLKILEDQSNYLRQNDPVYDLYKTIAQLRKIYE
ncbi:ATP-binding protein [Chryseobacterium sp. WX]|uniref:AAA family ATPase n=1 Tax=Chryseobacterium sp. WX TaxID=3031803 RepID=UPI00240A6C17|nr:ATP-binding protein [Chryseobacterium sp. WX]WFB70045.1 ATP-binding protein [Chryseobacterium sp. WX]